MFSDVRQGLADLFLELCIVMIYLLGQIRNCTCVNNCLRQIHRVFGDLVQSKSSYSFQVRVRFLQGQNCSLNTSRLSYTSGQILVVSALDQSYLAMQARAQMADYLTPGSNSYTQIASDSKAPLLMIAFDSTDECFAKERRTKQAAFLQKTQIFQPLHFAVQVSQLAEVKRDFVQLPQPKLRNGQRFCPGQELHCSVQRQWDRVREASTVSVLQENADCRYFEVWMRNLQLAEQILSQLFRTLRKRSGVFSWSYNFIIKQFIRRQLIFESQILPQRVYQEFISRVSRLKCFASFIIIQFQMLEVPNYNIVRTLGSGAFGYVFQAVHRKTGKRYALKRIEKVGKAISRENEMLLILKGCPNIIQIEDLFYTQNTENKLVQNIVFQYLQTNLEDIIKKHSKKCMYIPSQTIKLYMYQILNGIKHAHSKMVAHRDLKPQNILVNNQQQLKICDFGCSKIIDPKGKNTPYVGSQYYRAPELLMGIVNYTVVVDIWSIGCIIAELALLQPIFVGANEGDQLFAILKVLGSLTKEDESVYLKRVPFEANMMSAFQNFKKVNLLQKFNHMEERQLFVNLLEKMLTYVPDKRISAAEALKHPYFKNLNSQMMQNEDEKM